MSSTNNFLLLLCCCFVCKGISRKTQELLLSVSVLRYLDVPNTFYSVYHSTKETFFLSSSVLILVSMYQDRIRSTYRPEHDAIHHWVVIFLPCLLFVIVGSMIRTLYELYWCLSIVLESVALIPQAYMFRKYRQVENLTGGAFLLAMGMYRGLYILNWVVRGHTESFHHHDYLVYACAVVQVMVGLGGVVCVSYRDAAPLLPQLIQLYRDLHLGWFVAISFLFYAVMGQTFDSHVFWEGNYLAAIVLLPFTMFPFVLWYALIVHCTAVTQFLYAQFCSRPNAADAVTNNSQRVQQGENETLLPRNLPTEIPKPTVKELTVVSGIPVV